MHRDASSELDKEPEGTKPVVPVLHLRADTVRDEEFGSPDENVFLTVENVTFVVYKSRLSEFRKLKPMLQSHTEIELEGKAIDFRHTFRVLWPKIFYFSSSEFDTAVWMSALRVATNYDHPTLRRFAISNLERKELPIMDYVPLAREFDVPHWEDRATNYLVSRDEPITVEEAELLGIESFARVVVRREQRLVRRLDQMPAKPTGESHAIEDSDPRASHKYFESGWVLRPKMSRTRRVRNPINPVVPLRGSSSRKRQERKSEAC